MIYNAVIVIWLHFLYKKRDRLSPVPQIFIHYFLSAKALLIAETSPLIEDTMISECLPTPQYILSPQEIPTYETASDVDFLSRACSVYVSTVKSKFKACLIAFATASRRPLPSAV